MTRRAFRLTDERRLLVEQFVRYRYLRMSHLYAIYEAGKEVTDRGVRRLVHGFWAHGYLHRRVAPGTAAHAGSVEFSYWLSPRGVALAEDAELSKVALPEPRHGISRTLDHELAVTDFHLAAARALATRGMSLHWEQYGLRRGVNPDALFAVTDPAKPSDSNTSYGFLEIERSRLGGYSNGRSVLLRRLKRYASYQGSDECRKDWRWFNEFRVVIVVTSEARRRNLLSLLAAELPLPMFWITTHGAALTESVFQSPADFRERAYAISE